jgi:isoquinoline 1-oxidoreductase beta subunit
MAQVAAEELGCAWEHVAIAQAPVEAAYFTDGGYSTGGSGAVLGQFDPLRKAAAAARIMLTEEAGERWGAPAADCSVHDGQVRHAKSGRALGFGALAEGAAKRKAPADPPLKPRSEWRVIGKRLPRQDIPPKTDGSALYAIDVKLPGMLTGAVAQCPIYEGRLASMDEAAAMKVPGVRKVVKLAAYHDKQFVNMPLQETVAVVADGWWQAQQGLKALNPQWAAGDKPFSSAEFMEQLRKDVISPGEPPEPGRDDHAIFREGDTEADQRARLQAAFKDAAQIVDREYEVPMIAHATMEPMSAVARWTDGKLEVWTGTQAPRVLADVCARVLGIDPPAVTAHITCGGGGFGRRFYPDAGVQAAQLAREMKAPVKVVWTRAEDTQHDMYRPPAVARFRAAIGKDGTVMGVEMRQGRLAMFNVQGRYQRLAYEWPAFAADFQVRPQKISWGAWRAVEDGPQNFVLESYVDELAHALGQDPIAYRKSLLTRQPRALRLLDAVAEKSGWGTPLPAGRGRGVALCYANGSIAAEVAEVSVAAGKLKVERVTCAFDCGTVVNPTSVETQGEGAIVFGLTAALFGEITFKDGRVEQGNFDSYPMLRMSKCPKTEIHLLESPDARIGGVGEPMTPPIAPAVANAIFAATGQRLRKLPLLGQGLTLA